MPGSVIGTKMGLGFPGTYARSGDFLVGNHFVQATDDNGPQFGEPVVGNADNTVTSVKDYVSTSPAGTFTAAKFKGVAVREVKTITTYQVGTQEQTQYNPGDPCDVLKRGHVSVVCQLGTPVAEGAVYVRVEANDSYPTAVVGGFEYRTDTDSSKCVLLTNCQWATGEIDANKVCELAILYPLNA